MVRWLHEPGVPPPDQGDGRRGHDERPGWISFGAGPATDWFRDPRGSAPSASAPVAVLAEGVLPVLVGCSVEVAPRSTYDAAGLLVHYDDAHWVKFALELDPQGRTRIVTVRTVDVSDDCNHLVLDQPTCDLRIAADETSVALHARPGGTGPWELIRYAAHPIDRPPTIGALVQSPVGEGLEARFGSVTIERRRLDELRDGS